MLLAIDTATRFASIALYDAMGVVAEQSWRSDNNHSVEVPPAIASLLAIQGAVPGDLTGVAVAKGPGSFTGLRIGMSIAKGLCMALDIPIVAVPTLDIVTFAAGDPGTPILSVLEAGRGRVCVGRYRYEEGLPLSDGDIDLVRATEWVVDAEEPVYVTGEISAALADQLLSQPDGENIAISSLAASVRRAGYLGELAWERIQNDRVDDLDTLGPLYAHYPTSGTAA